MALAGILAEKQKMALVGYQSQIAEYRAKRAQFQEQCRLLMDKKAQAEDILAMIKGRNDQSEIFYLFGEHSYLLMARDKAISYYKKDIQDLAAHIQQLIKVVEALNVKVSGSSDSLRDYLQSNGIPFVQV